MFIRTLDGNLLRYESDVKSARLWISNNGYKVKYVVNNTLYVIDSDAWFIY